MVSPQILFVTSKLAEPALRAVVADVASRVGFRYGIAVLPISVAALATTTWITRHMSVPEQTERIILPGLCLGDLAVLLDAFHLPVERGPADLRDLPEFFGERSGRPADFGPHDIWI